MSEKAFFTIYAEAHGSAKVMLIVIKSVIDA